LLVHIEGGVLILHICSNGALGVACSMLYFKFTLLVK
jgi:hypothetical protein